MVGESLVSLVRRVFEDGILEDLFNKTLLVLIPKVAGPESITQFMPISLYTVPYKIISKVIVKRLKHIMSVLIIENQTIFVRGQHYG